MHGKASITVRASREEARRLWVAFVEHHADSRLRRAGIDASRAVGFVTAPGDRGTELHLQLDYDVTGGAVGAALQKVRGDDPLQLARDDLRRFKQLVETGEIARSDGAPEGSDAEAQPRQRPAQPAGRTPA